jgi:hypothetical protein
MASVFVEDGVSCLLWDDCWAGQPLKLAFPEFFSFVKKPTISLNTAALMNPTSNLFNLPLSVQAFDQFQQVQTILPDFTQTNENDSWSYIWGNSFFTSKKAYRQLLGTRGADPIFKKIWKSSCQPKHKVFFWLLIQDRLSSRNLLRRKNMHLPSYGCVLCLLDPEETLNHLFLECAFARECWALIGLTVVSDPDPLVRFESFKSQLHTKFYMEIIIIMCWSIWAVRNDFIFIGIVVSSLRGLEIFKITFKQLLWRTLFFKKKQQPYLSR